MAKIQPAQVKSERVLVSVLDSATWGCQASEHTPCCSSAWLEDAAAVSHALWCFAASTQAMMKQVTRQGKQATRHQSTKRAELLGNIRRALRMSDNRAQSIFRAQTCEQETRC